MSNYEYKIESTRAGIVEILDGRRIVGRVVCAGCVCHVFFIPDGYKVKFKIGRPGRVPDKEIFNIIYAIERAVLYLIRTTVDVVIPISNSDCNVDNIKRVHERIARYAPHLLLNVYNEQDETKMERRRPLNATEAIHGYIEFLLSDLWNADKPERKETARKNMLDMAAKFAKQNGLPSVREGWEKSCVGSEK